MSSESHPSTVAYTCLPITRGNYSKSVTSTTARPTNSMAVEHIEISSNKALFWKSTSLEISENLSIITICTSDNFFLKLAFIYHLSQVI